MPEEEIFRVFRIQVLQTSNLHNMNISMRIHVKSQDNFAGTKKSISSAMDLYKHVLPAAC